MRVEHRRSKERRAAPAVAPRGYEPATGADATRRSELNGGMTQARH